MKRPCCIIMLIFGIALAALLYKFIVVGETVIASDQRTAIMMTQGERDMVLGEMRTFLETVQIITAALVKDDLKSAAAAARKVGMGATGEVPASLVTKLPLAFKTLGFGTHEKFDQLALNAEQFPDKTETLSALSQLMQNCVACHAAYRIDTEVQ
ncbi:MAG: hypothetical protein ABW116_09560 [Candidatus Sedimenticola sp. 20ELBAFRAG]